MDNKILTIFTPTYNRAYSLHLGYEALLRQTSKNFIWLIIDDGSTDNTSSLVKKWIKDNIISIDYYYQENQGMHGAHNTAYRHIKTELNVCIDSDDYMPDDAVENIIKFWNSHGSFEYAGIIGLDESYNDVIIGTRFSVNIKSTTLGKFYSSGGKGDKKIVYRTDIVNKYPEYPIFKGEKYVSLAYKYELIDQDYELLTLNKPLVKVEYKNDGSTRNMYKQYFKNPKGFAFIRKSSMVLAPTYKRRFIEAVHYVTANIIMHNWKFLIESPKKLLTIIAIIPGFLFYIYILYKYKTNIYYI